MRIYLFRITINFLGVWFPSKRALGTCVRKQGDPKSKDIIKLKRSESGLKLFYLVETFSELDEKGLKWAVKKGPNGDSQSTKGTEEGSSKWKVGLE